MNLDLDIPVAGLAKDEKHQTSNLLFGDPLEISPVSTTIVRNFICCSEFKMKFTDLQSHFIANSEENQCFNQF